MGKLGELTSSCGLGHRQSVEHSALYSLWNEHQHSSCFSLQSYSCLSPSHLHNAILLSCLLFILYCTVLENSVTKNPYYAVKVLISVWMQTFSNHTIRLTNTSISDHEKMDMKCTIPWVTELMVLTISLCINDKALNIAIWMCLWQLSKRQISTYCACCFKHVKHVPALIK